MKLCTYLCIVARRYILLTFKLNNMETREIKKIPFNPDKFFWAFCKVTRYIGEPVTNKTGNRLVTVQTYDTEMATTLKTMLTYAFDVKGILTNHVDHTKFIIKY